MSSTSDIAKEILLSDSLDVELPLLILCDEQTSGRGQTGRVWQSNRESLTFTWCVSVESIPTANQCLLPLIAGVSICEAIESLGIVEAKLKWPNDILIQRKKVCGILVEKIPSGDQSWFLIGIGINVNQSKLDFEKLDESKFTFPPGSLKAHCGHEFDLQTVLLTTVKRLVENTKKENQWTEHFCDRFDFLGERITFTKANGEEVQGIFSGVDSTGSLQLEIDGVVQSFLSGRFL